MFRRFRCVQIFILTVCPILASKHLGIPRNNYQVWEVYDIVHNAPCTVCSCPLFVPVFVQTEGLLILAGTTPELSRRCGNISMPDFVQETPGHTRFRLLSVHFILFSPYEQRGGGGVWCAARLRIVFYFPCSADHKRDWPRYQEAFSASHPAPGM